MPGEHSHRRGVDYDRTADEYAAHRQIHPGVYEALCAQVGPGGAVLEVGCGTGNYIAALSQRLAGRSACGAWGLDPSQGMLAHARARPAPATWIQGLAQLLPFAPEQFDLIFSVDVIHHVADAAAYYRQAARALRPGGGYAPPLILPRSSGSARSWPAIFPRRSRWSWPATRAWRNCSSGWTTRAWQTWR